MGGVPPSQVVSELKASERGTAECGAGGRWGSRRTAVAAVAIGTERVERRRLLRRRLDFVGSEASDATVITRQKEGVAEDYSGLRYRSERTPYRCGRVIGTLSFGTLSFLVKVHEFNSIRLKKTKLAT